MSSKQGQTLDVETLQQMREDARQRDIQRKAENEAKAADMRERRAKAQKRLREAARKRNQKSFWDNNSYKITFGILGGILLLVILQQILGMGRNLHKIPVLEDEFIRRINEDGKSFKAKTNTFFEGMNLAEARDLLNNRLLVNNKVNKCATPNDNSVIDPKYNYSKDKPFCSSPVFDQGICSSGFAVASIGAFTDRYCLINNGLKKFDTSIQHALACDTQGSRGCKGGAITGTFQLGQVNGFVTSSCMSYDVDKADTCPVDKLKKCFRRKVESYCVVEGEEAIKREILNNGPVVSVVPVTREFLVYGGGIYNIDPESFKLPGGQAVKIIGWGSSPEGVKYWIIENSWGTSWGVKGYARVKIGIENSTLDKYAIAVTPDNGNVIKN